MNRTRYQEGGYWAGLLTSYRFTADTRRADDGTVIPWYGFTHVSNLATVIEHASAWGATEVIVEPIKRQMRPWDGIETDLYRDLLETR